MIELTGKFAIVAVAAALFVASASAQTAAKTNDIDKVGDSAERMAEKPLKDLNLTQDKIPPELLAVMNKPYDLSGMTTCAQYKAAIDKLTKVLGPDVDSPKVMGKKESSTEVMLGGAEAVVGGLIPGTGLIRKLSGAEAAQNKAKAAVLAGSLRRAYIKGVAKGKGCKI
nr:hypothetical protein [Polymorphobacter sp.]